MANELLYLYLAGSEIAVSGVLVREEKGTQYPVYYVSRTLGDAETRYPHLEKFALALLTASRKLKPYFQCHPVCDVTSYPLRNVMHKPELSGRLAKWAMEISGYDIEYKLRTAIKSQILADFVADFAPAIIPEVDKEMLLTSRTSTGVWTLYTDGASNVKAFGLGIVLKPPSNDVIRQYIRSVDLTNNEAEYEAMIAGLELAKSFGVEIIEAKCDSLLVVNQKNGTFEIKDDRMWRYQEKLRVVLRRFKEWTLEHVPRDQNDGTDALANLGSSVESYGFNSGAVVQLTKSVIETDHAEIKSTSLTWDWRNKYVDYLQIGKLPYDAKESRALRTKAARFCLVDGQLYRRSFHDPLARCLGPGETDYVLRQVHEGTCGNHSGADSLVRKLIRAGYYWNRMEDGAKTFVRKCNECQRHAPSIHQPGEKLHQVLSPWPFMKWRMDIVGPFLWAPDKTQFILLMTDYFSKWVKAQAREKVREKEVIDFIYEHIICRFGVPAEIACDNGKQFIGSKVSKFFEEYKIKKILSTPYHRSANGQAESTNKTILQNLKKRLADSKHRWKEVLPEVLWAYRTMVRSSARETPFPLYTEPRPSYSSKLVSQA
ncbi:uncharacterized protein LOC132614297 [Lycium barbarum]|uniref:uncharacterized protein LOC132614297 n=1 Tax=Lycium barbarum TaxID=112863 RepID=UPI00293E888F|nr:uncharacterized protein LOC132614297 [Lycium barbarum]